MQNKRYQYLLLWFGALLVFGFLVWSITFLVNANHGRPSSMRMKPDDVLLGDSDHGNRLLTNKTAGYAFALPSNWYFERSLGSGVAVYPDYDAQKQSGLRCKIEISALQNPAGIDLNDWLAAYFQEDPTLDVDQVSVLRSDDRGIPAITWIGSLNGVSTTLIYIANKKMVYEVAPLLVGADGKSGDDCVDSARGLLSTFQLAP